MAKRKRKALQRKIALRNHNKWARWYIENHVEELDELLFDKYGLELKLTTRQKEKFIKDVLTAVWKSIHNVTFANRNELYWCRRVNGKGELVFAILVEPENLHVRRKFKISYEQRKRKLEEDNDSSDS
jgi:hypothetical protein